MKLSVNQKCILSFIAGMLVCCMYKHYHNNVVVNGMLNLPERMPLQQQQQKDYDSVVGTPSTSTQMVASFP